MKWEILKGSEKDFEGAPDSATVRIFEKGFEEHISIFADKFETGSIRTHADTGVYNSYIGDVSHWSVVAERRPITEPDVNQQVTTEWDGAGIARLGQHLEYFWGEGKEWRKAEVVAHYEEWPLLKDIEDGLMVAEINNKMRPIRSPEDAARDKITLNMLQYMYSSDETDYAQVCKIYDAIADGKIPGVKLEGVK